jgi:hypothetical protein
MEAGAQYRGSQYETLMLRAFKLHGPSYETGADRRVYDMLYYIQKGYDLRNIGYWTQLTLIRKNVGLAIQSFLKRKIYKDEKVALRLLLMQLDVSFSEPDIYKVIEKTLETTERLTRVSV